MFCSKGIEKLAFLCYNCKISIFNFRYFMKNKSKNIFYALAGMVILGVLGVSALKQGALLQSNLSIPHASAPQHRAVVMNMLVPTNQIRKGEMPFLKFNMTGTPDLKINKMKVNLHAYDIGIVNLRFLRNGKDVTAQLTPEAKIY